MAREVIGHMNCPICDFVDGEVKQDKNNNPYFYCPDCNQQILTHGKEPRASKMLAKMRPIAPPGDPQPAPVVTPRPRTLLG